MALRFYNTLTQKLETFPPLHDNVVRMYTCGPTVYNFVHIGNLRTFTFQDILRRWLRARGYTLDHVMNITDVEDKIIRNAAEQHKSHCRVHRAFTRRRSSKTARRCGWSGPERLVKATEHIQDMVATIETARRARLHLRERRVRLLPHREFSVLREAFAQRFQRHSRRCARGCG